MTIAAQLKVGDRCLYNNRLWDVIEFWPGIGVKVRRESKDIVINQQIPWFEEVVRTYEAPRESA